MNLQNYIQRDKGNATTLAAFLEVPLSYLSQMASGNRSVSPERALAIERFTNELVTRQDLRPDDCWKIWPDLAHLAPSEGKVA